MSKASTFLGGSIPVGAIVTGQFASDPKFLPCDGSDYLSSDYPSLDKTGLSTWGTNSLVTRTLPVTQQWTGIAFGAGVHVMVGCGSTGIATATTISASSSDGGATWTQRTMPSGCWWGVIFANGLFVAYGTSGSIATSPDGITWTARTTPATMASGSYHIHNMLYGKGLYLGVFQNTSGVDLCVTSPDAITWTIRGQASVAASAYVKGAAVANDAFFIGVATNGAGVSNVVFKSQNGVAWTYNNATIGYSSANYGPTDFVVNFGHWTYFNGIIFSGNGNRSVDGGVTWIPKPGASPLLYDFMSATNGVLFNSSNGTTLEYTLDGINWKTVPGSTSAQATAISSYPHTSSVAFGNGNYVFHGTGAAGQTNNCYTLAVDSTKFRVPLIPQTPGSIGNNYIKVT